MRSRVSLLFLLLETVALTAQSWSDMNSHPLPRGAVAAKTVAILNDTHAVGVSAGAAAECKEWATCASSTTPRMRIS
jgi:hypothetical protein